MSVESLKLKDAAARRGCSRRTLWNAIHSGSLPAHRLTGGGAWYVRVDDLDAWTPPDARARLRAYHERMGHKVAHDGPARDVIVLMADGRAVLAEIESTMGAGLPLDADFGGFKARLDRNLAVYREQP